MSFSPDDIRLVTGSEDYKIIVWNCILGTIIYEFIDGHSSGINKVFFSFDGSTLFSVGSDNKIVSWDAEKGELMNKRDFPFSINGSDISQEGKMNIKKNYNFSYIDRHQTVICLIAFYVLFFFMHFI